MSKFYYKILYPILSDKKNNIDSKINYAGLKLGEIGQNEFSGSNEKTLISRQDTKTNMGWAQSIYFILKLMTPKCGVFQCLR